MLVQEFLEKSADWYGDKTALVFENQRLTYCQVERQANALANALRSRGFGRGARAVLWLPNCVELVVSIFAVLKAGGVFCIVNSSAKTPKLTHITRNCQAQVLITTWQKGDEARLVREEVDSLETLVLTSPTARGRQPGDPLPATDFLSFDDIYRHPPSRPPHVNIDLDLACLIYTAGASGEPKGVMSDHSNVVFVASSIIKYLHNVPEDVVVNVLPLSIDYGLYQLLTVFKFGGTLVLESGCSFPGPILRRMKKERVTGLPGVATVFAMLLTADLRAYDLKLRYITNTGAPLPSSDVATLAEIWPETTLYTTYGLTETKSALYLPPHERARRPGAAGIAIPGTEVWIVDELGNRLGPGETGELVVRGRNVMRGYWGDEEATNQRFRPGLLVGERVCCTGDLFTMDEDGFFYFVSHQVDTIDCRGEQVVPQEVEQVLKSLPGVVEAAVVGVPDRVQGQAIKAFVVTDDQGLTEAEIMTHCRKNLDDLMLPKYVVLCQELPKTAAGQFIKSDMR